MSDIITRAKEFIEKNKRLKEQIIQKKAVLKSKQQELMKHRNRMTEEFQVGSLNELEDKITELEADLEKLISIDMEVDVDNDLFDD